jgi:hypothetical protein
MPNHVSPEAEDPSVWEPKFIGEDEAQGAPMMLKLMVTVGLLQAACLLRALLVRLV